ncbi:MAG: PD-(D/E)XK nuclease family protein [Bacteroidia bacterium]
MTFLREVAEHILNAHKNESYKVQIVIPSKRSALFLKNELKQKANKDAFFFPDIVTINEFVSQFLQQNIADSNSLIFEFYDVYRNTLKDKAEPFDAFVKWAPSLLSDFSEVDRYLVNPKAIFSDLRNIKEIENWSFNSDELSGSQTNYLKFWNTFYELYVNLNKYLEDKKLITSGGAYRLVAENIDHLAKTIKHQKIYFIGFNALSKSEFTIFKTLHQLGMAEVIFDVDDYYLNIHNHEAGYFFKRLISEFNLDKKWIKSNTVSTKKSIKIIAAPNDFSQAQVVSTLIDKGDFALDSDNAIVLSDQNLLMPIIDELPEIAASANITMGYPPKLTLVFSLFDVLFKMHENAQRYSSKEVHRFHFDDVFDLLGHPFLVQYLPSFLAFKNYCIKRNLSFINFEEIEQDINEQSFLNDDQKSKIVSQISYLKINLSFLFERWNNSTQIINSCLSFINFLKQKEFKNLLEKEALFVQWKVFNQLSELYSKYEFLNESNYFKKIYRTLLSNEQISLVGEPLKGIQLIGMLETRLIDYKNLIVTSVNEGILPKSKIDNAIIPYDLKRHYGLPTYKEKDAIYAYYFYRLLHRSENVWLLYNSDNEGFSSGEYSRYVLQLKHEFPNKNIIEFLNVSQSSTFDKSIVKEFQKDDFYYQRLNYLVSEKGLSPSAINAWLSCPKDFYVKYILGLREQEEIEEEIGDNVLGTVIHKVLEQLYSPFVGKNITAFDVKNFRKSFKPLLEDAFKKEYSKFYKTGKNYITFNVAEKLIDSFLANDERAISKSKETRIISLEQQLEAEFEIKGKKVKLRGVVDRIDEANGLVRISDYKSGGVEEKDVKIKSYEEILSAKTKPKAIQLLTYAYVFFKSNNINQLSSQIITMRNINDCFYPLSIENNSVLDKSLLRHYELLLENILNEMYDQNLPIEHNPKQAYCLMC